MNRKVIQIVSLMAIFGCVAIGFTSCGKKNPNSPGVEFMPDMYRSPSLESNMAYEKIVDGQQTTDTLQANRLPVARTIARGFMPYPYANDTAGYGQAGRLLKNPFEKTEANIIQGEILYGKFCVQCHGISGQGDGLVALKLPGAPPSYTGPVLMALPEGQMFHTLTYGKNLMGSHASQLTVDERWKLVMFVQKLQGKLK